MILQNFFCDCDAATVPGVYEGLYCEHEATTYCTDDSSVSRSSFCTNGGSCIEVVGDQNAGFACDCPAAYIGDHCQFIASSQPEDWDTTPAYTVSNTGGGGSKGGAIAGIAIGLIVVIVAAALFVKKRPSIFGSQKGADGDVADESASPVKSPAESTGDRDELQLEADGSVLQGALPDTGSPAKTHAESNQNGDTMENEEDLESNENMPNSPSAEDSEII